VKNRKQFFDTFARDSNFDPLVSTNWYSVTKESIKARKDSEYVLFHYRGNFIKALEHLYPNIGLNSSKFTSVQTHYWADAKNRRSFFDDFAADLNFDPLVPSNWYSVSKSVFEKRKGLASVLIHYQGSIPKALEHLYPNIKLDRKKFGQKKQ